MFKVKRNLANQFSLLRKNVFINQIKIEKLINDTFALSAPSIRIELLGKLPEQRQLIQIRHLKYLECRALVKGISTYVSLPLCPPLNEIYESNEPFRKYNSSPVHLSLKQKFFAVFQRGKFAAKRN